MLILKQLLVQNGVRQVELARSLNLSPAAINQLINYGIYPKSLDKEDLQASIKSWLMSKSISFEANLFEESVTESGNSQQPFGTSPVEEDYTMLLKKQLLRQETKQNFGIFGDPFRDPVNSDDLFLSPEMRYVRETLWASVQYPSFTAIVGESGSGKSTIRKDLKNRIAKANETVLVIEPYVLAMEDNDLKGKTLKSTQIADAILAKVAPKFHPKRSAEAKFRQVHEALMESSKIGNKHMLIIEEAHSLPIPTLKHLKRFFELESEDGYTRLLSVVLIGQSELALKLNEADPRVREVVQRCELVTLYPLGENLQAYLTHCFKRVNKKLAEIISDEGVEALKKRLTNHTRNRTSSMLYPLAINNLTIAALNMAANVGEAVVTAEVIDNVGKG